MSRTPVRLAAAATELPQGWKRLRSGGCPCCVGRVQMQVDLVRLVREDRPRGVLIELPDAAHRHALRRSLGEWPLSDYVVVLPD